MDPRLLDLVDEKIEHLRRYNEITSRIVYEDVDGVGELIAQMQAITTTVNGVSAEIKGIINEQSVERQDTINALFCFEEISGLTGSMKELAVRIDELHSLTDEVKKNDRLAREHLEQMREETYQEMIRGAKGKKVVQYFGATAVDVNKGNQLNTSK